MATAVGIALAIFVISVPSTTGLRFGKSFRVEKCVMPEPELHLKKKYKVALFTPRTADSDYEMLREGIHDHPMLELVTDMKSADYVLSNIYGDSYTDTLPPPEVPVEKVVVVDWSDGPIVPPYMNASGWNALFKRSYVIKDDSVLTGLAHDCGANCYPFAYGVMNQYLSQHAAESVGDHKARPISLMCSLRPVHDPDPELMREYWIVRNRVLDWLHADTSLPEDAVISGLTSHGLTSDGFDTGIVSLLEKGSKDQFHYFFDQVEGSDSKISPEYRAILEKARVAVTANPATYEGDHRMWEHFANGNAVLSDHIYIPIPFAPRAGKHYKEFDAADKAGNKLAFQRKLHQMLAFPAKTQKMACEGMKHAAKHHRSVNRVDYIIRTMAQKDESVDYPETGMKLKEEGPTTEGH